MVSTVTDALAPVTGAVAPLVTTVTSALAPVTGAAAPLVTTVTSALAPVTGALAPLITGTTGVLAAVTTPARMITQPVTGTGGQSAVGVWGIARSLQAGSASATEAAALSAGMSSQRAGTDGGTPVSSAPMLPRLPVMPGGGPNGATGTGGPGGGNGGNGGSAAQGGASANLRTLILLRLAHYAAAKPIWLTYLPEVPPA